MTRMPSLAKTASKSRPNLLSRSRIRKRNPPRQLPASEHRRLKRRAMRVEIDHLRARNWLHDPMDMNRRSTCVRPQAHVGLVGTKKLLDHRRGMQQRRAYARSFCFAQFGNVDDVASRLDHQSPHPKRPDAVLHPQVLILEDASSGRLLPTLGQVTGKAALHTPTVPAGRCLQRDIRAHWRSAAYSPTKEPSGARMKSAESGLNARALPSSTLAVTRRFLSGRSSQNACNSTW